MKELQIQNAGLVLMYPFIENFFEQLEILKSSLFVSDEAKNRAVFLLQYLVYSRIDFQEDDLVLNKLLLGIPLEQPLIYLNKLTDQEITFCENLFNDGFKKNWNEIKKASISEIQYSFLQRKGIIKIEETRIIIDVERNSYDELTMKIPWTISFIRFPWLEKIIQVNWF